MKFKLTMNKDRIEIVPDDGQDSAIHFYTKAGHILACTHVQNFEFIEDLSALTDRYAAFLQRRAVAEGRWRDEKKCN